METDELSNLDKRLEYIKAWRLANKEYMSEYNKQYSAQPRNRSRKLFLAYGITLFDFEEMVQAQEGRCLICEEIKPLVVDHCHQSNIVRGLLCTTCNKWLGLYELWKSDQRFETYLGRQPMGQLDAKDYAVFNQLIEELEPEIDNMKETPQSFVKDMVSKNKQYGERVFVSPKQLDWIKRLHEEYIGDTDHDVDPEADGRHPPRDMDDDIPF